MEAVNRYCLQTRYWLEGDPSSHLSDLGAEVSQDTLVAFIKRVTEDILFQDNATVSRTDVDRKILQFREGLITIEEVQEWIERYNQSVPKANRVPSPK